MIRSTTGGFIGVGVAAVLSAGAARAQTQTLFFDDFESTTVKPQWSWVHLSAQTPFSRFSGRYSNNTIKLQLDAPPPPPPGTYGDGGNGDGNSGGNGDNGGGSGFDTIRYTLTFDFYAIDSWDGNDPRHGPDRFEINNGASVIFSETFGNVWLNQSYREPDVGRWNMAYGSAPDAIYRNITVQFDQAPGEKVKLWFYDKGLQGLSDESWGIDNVRIQYQYVPTPAGALLGAAPVLGILRRRRR